MRLNELGNREILNISDGSRLGIFAEADLLIEEKTGIIKLLLIPEYKNPFSLFPNRNFLEVPWNCIKKIGNDMIIIELDGISYDNYL